MREKLMLAGVMFIAFMAAIGVCTVVAVVLMWLW